MALSAYFVHFYTLNSFYNMLIVRILAQNLIINRLIEKSIG